MNYLFSKLLIAIDWNFLPFDYLQSEGVCSDANFLTGVSEDQSKN